MPTASEPLPQLLALLSEPAMVLHRRGRIVHANAGARRLFGGAEDLLELAEDGDRAEELFSRWARSSSSTPAVLTLRTQQGLMELRMDGARWSREGAPHLLVRIRDRRRAGQVFATLSEEVDRLGTEVRRRRLAELRLAGQMRLLARIARAEPLPETLDAIARFVEEQAGDEILASILVVDGGRLRHGAGPSLPAAYIEAIDGVEIGPAVGSCGTAAFRGEAVIVADIENDPLWADFKGVALEHGLRACWSAPVIDDQGEVVATLAHYAKTPRMPRARDRDLTETALNLASLAIARHAREQALHARAEQLAERNARIHEFLAMLGHELRNPLSPMAAALELLRDRDADPEQRAEWRRAIERQHGLLRRLVDDLLDMARVTRGKVELRRAPVELTDLVASACQLDDPRVTCSFPERPLFIDGDAQRLTQVFGNLVQNACKFTSDDGSVLVGVTRDGEAAVVRVKDTGVGIAPAKLEHIFELFAQGDDSIDRSLGGLGIGLTLAKSLVEGHGGSLDARSDGLGRGSEFTVRLPLVAPPTVAADSAPSTSSPPPVAPLSVLVVDDQDEAALLTASLLRRWGHRAEVAFDGAEGLKRALTDRPDVLILDIGLPRLDGYQVAGRLRESEGWDSDSSLLVALTGYGQRHDRERAAAAGFDAFFVKPVDVEALRRLLAEHSRRRAGARAGRGD